MNRRQAELVLVWGAIVTALAGFWACVIVLVARYATMDWLFGLGVALLIVAGWLFVRETRLLQQDCRGDIDTIRRRR